MTEVTAEETTNKTGTKGIMNMLINRLAEMDVE